MHNQSGLILFVKNYQECIRFYRDRIGLAVTFEKPGITRFEFGSLYLQIEDCESMKAEPTRNLILRQNVQSVSGKQRELLPRDIRLEIHDLEWGKIGFVFDPSGNKVEYFRQK